MEWFLRWASLPGFTVWLQSAGRWAGSWLVWVSDGTTQGSSVWLGWWGGGNQATVISFSNRSDFFTWPLGSKRSERSQALSTQTLFTPLLCRVRTAPSTKANHTTKPWSGVEKRVPISRPEELQNIVPFKKKKKRSTIFLLSCHCQGHLYPSRDGWQPLPLPHYPCDQGQVNSMCVSPAVCVWCTSLMKLDAMD